MPTQEIKAGEVGYIAASIKSLSDIHVGDTVTLNDNPADKPLKGYKKVTPMVYCGLYPIDGSEYENLKVALEKLQLNDAALEYEPETSAALGFGFRCGFLGLLHLEIIEERLDREFDLGLITTAPSVIYKVHKTTIEVESKDNELGIPDTITYQYYIGTTKDNQKLVEAKTANTITYDNLQANTKYIVKVQTKDKMENVGTIEKEITTASPILVNEMTLSSR